ncbi:hypothetical protein LAJ19_14165 (plasmid) [Deinococcus taeanensis]|uniref:hypothetical protein n=1 Tax=Deinococcus taeanensis TaxID=2737050 RepID=UPI001CDD449F|nr:hypothetical protein [Deinococcus taeanensis]UBV44311.1 hypothetical protein LAJ19_14165 [Deinococcus taeanensis]
MQKDVKAHDLGQARLPDLTGPHAPPPASPLTRLLNALAVRPALARVLSDGLIILVVSLGGLGAVIGVQKGAANPRPPLEGMAELHAQLLSLPPEAAPDEPPPGPAVAAQRSQVQRLQVQRSQVRAAPAASRVPAGSAAHTPARAVPDAGLASPVTGAARTTVLRLTKAAGFIVPAAVLERSTATVDLAGMLARVGRPVAARTLRALQAAPSDPALIADLTRQVRSDPGPAGRLAAPTAAPATRTAGQGAPVRAAPAVSAAGVTRRAPVARVTAVVTGTRRPEAVPEVGALGPGRLAMTLDDPLPVNTLQMMTEQAVTPLTPRN